MLRPRSCGEDFSQEEGSLAFPSYPGRANFLSISLQNLVNLRNGQLARQKGDPRAGSFFLHGRVTPSRINSFST